MDQPHFTFLASKHRSTRHLKTQQADKRTAAPSCFRRQGAAWGRGTVLDGPPSRDVCSSPRPAEGASTSHLITQSIGLIASNRQGAAEVHKWKTIGITEWRRMDGWEGTSLYVEADLMRCWGHQGKTATTFTRLTWRLWGHKRLFCRGLDLMVTDRHVIIEVQEGFGFASCWTASGLFDKAN